MELSATSKSMESFQLEANDYQHAEVNKRLNSVKQLKLHPLSDDKKTEKDLIDKALSFQESGKAILIYASRVETVLEIASKIEKTSPLTKTLTGTMRGKERDELVSNDVFQRFLPGTKTSDQTVYLICTSAGEVGVNISADHLICDLTTFESMAQRFGRVNRFGNSDDCEVHVFYPNSWDEKDPLTIPRQKTLQLLRELNGSVSPKALSGITAEDRNEAFAPGPTILPVTDMLFDAWALTTIRGKLPGRPEVEPYLHGLSGYEPPETYIAWREEVEHLSEYGFAKERIEVLSAYPLLPREILRELSYRAIKQLKELASRNPDDYAWIVDNHGEVNVVQLSYFKEKENERIIEHSIVILQPRSGGLSAGMFDGKSEIAGDVSVTLDRCRCWNDEVVPEGLHEVYQVAFSSENEEDDPDVWYWYARRNNGEPTAKKPVEWQVHVADVVNKLADILGGLDLEESLTKCLMLAAKYHDHGKKRKIFQSMLGNRNSPSVWWAKSGQKRGTIIEENYRHEFGSLHDIIREPDYLGLSLQEQSLVRHLIATHHGRARPHFPWDEIFDPHSAPQEDREIASQVLQDFGRLQRKYGRWGLAYIESLLRAADWAASRSPSRFVEEEECKTSNPVSV